MYSSADTASETVQQLPPGTAFLIAREEGAWWEVTTADGVSGWVRHELCMINLPDVIPSIIYNDTNAYSSMFASSGYALPEITGEKLYDAYFYNERLGRNEYIVPLMYATAKRLSTVQKRALAEGNTLIVYEAYRPSTVQSKVFSALENLCATNENVWAGINNGSWSINWFIAGGTSVHQQGFALDMSLALVTGQENASSGEFTYKRCADYNEYTMPSLMHELSAQAVTFTYPKSFSSRDTINVQSLPLSESMRNSPGALKLQEYCIEAGFSPLASEWWHFNDLVSRDRVSETGRGDFDILVCLSVAP
jgi:D-alanyl-D-alanine dipeptidase